MTSFHVFQNHLKDKYDFILGRDLFKDLGLDIHYGASQFVWENISVNMVPSGYWTKNKITRLTKTWNGPCKETLKTESKNEKLHIAQLLPAEYKPVDIAEVVQKQTCFKANTPFDFQTLFQGKRGEFKGP
jgi:hypothetical protein